MRARETLDVSGLPDSGFGPSSGPWWGTLGFMAAEATTLVLCAATYLYLGVGPEAWPPPGIPLPRLLLPTLGLGVLLASLIPAGFLDRAAKRKDVGAVKTWLVVGILFELAALALRATEFDAVNVRWDTHAYGSAVWFILGVHTTLLAADLAETGTFAGIFLAGRVEEKHFADVDDVVMYWRFLVYAWLPLYALVYLGPRLL